VNSCNRILSGDPIALSIRDLAKLRFDLDQKQAAGLNDAVTRALEAEYLKKEAQILSMGVSRKRLKAEVLKVQRFEQHKSEERARVRKEDEDQIETLKTSLKWVAKITPRVEFAQSVLPDGRLVISGGRENPYSVQSIPTIEWIDLMSGETGTFQDLQVGRWGHAQSTLPDGRIWISGGWGQPNGFLSSIETLDFQTGAMTLESLAAARAYHAQSVLSDGRVIVSGGLNFEGILTSVEQGGQMVANLFEGRTEHMQTLLPDGTLLVSGGSNRQGRFTSSIEIVDLKKGTSEKVGELPPLDTNPIQAPLSDGRVLLVSSNKGTSMLTVFDPSDRSLQELMKVEDLVLAATLTPEGQVALTADSGSVYLLKMGRR